MNVWQLQEAKAKLTQLIKDSMNEPQVISKHGVNQSVVMSMKRYKELLKDNESIVSFFRKSPLKGVNLKVKRDKSPMRDIEL